MTQKCPWVTVAVLQVQRGLHPFPHTWALSHPHTFLLLGFYSRVMCGFGAWIDSPPALTHQTQPYLGFSSGACPCVLDTPLPAAAPAPEGIQLPFVGPDSGELVSGGWLQASPSNRIHGTCFKVDGRGPGAWRVPGPCPRGQQVLGTAACVTGIEDPPGPSTRSILKPLTVQ